MNPTNLNVGDTIEIDGQRHTINGTPWAHNPDVIAVPVDAEKPTVMFLDKHMTTNEWEADA